MTKTQLIDIIAEKADLSKPQAKIVLEELLTGVTDALAQGDQVQLIGFGTFKVNRRAARTGRDLQTGNEIKIAAANVPAFVAGKALKDAIRIDEPVKRFELVKRLNPTENTKKHLYLESGNACAFPNCSQKLIDENGHYIGQICHIEAAETGGQRFNPNQTNEQRRHISNLMLMCPNHHKLTDDVIKYTVDKLKKMKADHERKSRYSQNDRDVDTLNKFLELEKEVLLPANLNTLDLNLSDYDPNFFNDVLDYIKRVADLPFKTRLFYTVAFYRGYIDDYRLCFDPRELKSCYGYDFDTIETHVSILQRSDLLSQRDDDDYPKVFYCFIGFDKDDHQINFLLSVKKIFGNRYRILEDMFIALNFNRLESN